MFLFKDSEVGDKQVHSFDKKFCWLDISKAELKSRFWKLVRGKASELCDPKIDPATGNGARYYQIV